MGGENCSKGLSVGTEEGDSEGVRVGDEEGRCLFYAFADLCVSIFIY